MRASTRSWPCTWCRAGAGALLAELHRVCKPNGEIFLVNHVRSTNPILGAVERGLARFSDQIGFPPDFDLHSLVNGSARVEHISNVFLWKVMRVRNGMGALTFPAGRASARA